METDWGCIRTDDFRFSLHSNFDFQQAMAEDMAEAEGARRRQVLHSQAREFVARLIGYFEREKHNCGTLLNVGKIMERTAAALQISVRTVQRINQERKKTDKPQFSTPGKTHNKKSVITELDNFDADAVRRHIYDYYRRKTVPTLDKLLESLKEAGLFSGSRTSLYKVLLDIGFVYRKLDNRTVLMEKPDVALKRCFYLRPIRKVDWEKVTFLDQTWINKNDCPKKGFTDGTVKGNFSDPKLGKGGRLIINHAGSARGWINAPPLVFNSKSTKDYHEEMNAETFEKWFLETLLPALEPGETIVMDNASYLSRILDKAPTTKNKKAEIVEWLLAHNVNCSMAMFKVELLNLVRLNKPLKPRYFLDEEAQKRGFRVIRLPPYHCQYNPIELAWAWMKNYVRTNNATQKMVDVKDLFLKAVEEFSPDKWRKNVEHVKKIVEEAWEQEGLHEEEVEQFLITLGADDFIESDSEYLDGSDEEDVVMDESIDDCLRHDVDLGVAFLPTMD